ncbi:unnamed protein product [Clonostachys rosea f. rosea IK726]|uniref:Uncharacterized protein n=2 Tax=Bionectria ochroleuca TaxID=29856 RepID=A0A0B7KFD1_BIOOC|nr:unnamed protein product [Clonostachys rosea f. rosea IK726]
MDSISPTMPAQPEKNEARTDHYDSPTYNDLPEVVQPDTSPQVTSSYQAEYSQRLNEGNPKYLVGYQEYSESDQFPQAMSQPDVSLKDDGHVKHELSSVKYDSSPSVEEQNPKKAGGSGSILGLKRNTFIIIVVALIVIIAAAIGGGVGGSRAAAASKSSTSTQSSEDTSTTVAAITTSSTTSQSSTTPTSSIPIPTETFLNNATDSGNKFAFQSFSEQNYNGNHTGLLRDTGKSDIGFNAQSFVWKPVKSNCCVTLCLNDTLRVGWTCDELYKTKVTETFLSIYVWCGEERDADGTNAICSTGKGPTTHT